MTNIVKEALVVMVGLAGAGLLIMAGMTVSDLLAAGAVLGAAQIPLVGAVSIGVVSIGWLSQNAPNRSVVELRICVVAAVLIGLWVLVGGIGESVFTRWLKLGLAWAAALVAHEARVTQVTFDANGERQIDIDDREIALVAHGLVVQACLFSGLAGLQFERAMLDFRNPLLVEAAVWSTFALVLICGLLLLRAGIAGGELRPPMQWNDDWSAVGDAVIETGWRVGLFAVLCAITAWVPVLVAAAHIIGPTALWLSGVGLGGLALTSVWMTARSWPEVMRDLGARLQDDAFALMLLTLMALLAFWVALICEWIGRDGLYPLLFAIVVAAVTVGFAVTHARDGVRSGLLNLAWLGMAGALAVLTCAMTKRTPVAWALLALAVVIVVAMPVVIQWSRIRWPLGWTIGEERETAGGRVRDGIPGDQLRHE